jgi:hypothetical protein
MAGILSGFARCRRLHPCRGEVSGMLARLCRTPHDAWGGVAPGETSLMLLTVGLLGMALISLAYRAKDRRGYEPLALGVVATSLILLEKWWLSAPWLLALGLALLVGASLLHAWPRQAINLGACAACAPHTSEGYEKAHN